MGRSRRDQRGQFRTMVRYDGRGRIIPSGNILKKGQKPEEGNWQAKEAYECCVTDTTTIAPDINSFKTTWQTTSPNESIIFPISADLATSNMIVDWGDSTGPQTYVDEYPTHTYVTAGSYTVSVSGIYDYVNFDDEYTNALNIISIDQWGTNQWSTMYYAFTGCENLQGNATDTPDLSICSDVSGMFSSCTIFNGDIGNWDVSNVTEMYEMFGSASSFNQDLSVWDVSNVAGMSNMFRQASSFNQPLNNWNVSNVTDMEDMFDSATAFNQPLSSWDVSSVTVMGRMFGDTAFNQNINNWNVSSVTYMASMFAGTSYNQPIGNWNVSSVTGMDNMFNNTTSFNQDISGWNVSSVTGMAAMFEIASSFNQDLSGWSVANVISCTNFSIGATAWLLPKPTFTNCVA